MTSYYIFSTGTKWLTKIHNIISNFLIITERCSKNHVILSASKIKFIHLWTTQLPSSPVMALNRPLPAHSNIRGLFFTETIKYVWIFIFSIDKSISKNFRRSLSSSIILLPFPRCYLYTRDMSVYIIMQCTSLSTLLYPHPYSSSFLLSTDASHLSVCFPWIPGEDVLTHTPIGTHKDGRTTDTDLPRPCSFFFFRDGMGGGRHQPCPCLMTQCWGEARYQHVPLHTVRNSEEKYIAEIDI